MSHPKMQQDNGFGRFRNCHLSPVADETQPGPAIKLAGQPWRKARCRASGQTGSTVIALANDRLSNLTLMPRWWASQG